MTNNNDYQLTNTAVEDILSKFGNGNNVSSAQILQTAMNLLMLAERNIFIQNNQQNKANGFFERELGTSIGNLNLKIPRDRNGNFRPEILPNPYQRDIQEKEQLLQSLLLNGYSPNAIKRALHDLDMHYNPKEINEIKTEYAELFKQWQSRQLPQDCIGMFIDAYHAETNINNKVRKSVLYVIVGVNFDSKKDLFGIYHFDGSENKAFWLQTLNQIIERGVKRPLIVVSDDFPGLKDAIAMLFPNALHQLCFIHMQRNVRRNMGTEDAKSFNTALKQIKLIPDHEICEKQFTELCLNYQKHYPAFTKSLIDDTKNYFAFKYLPTDVQKHFYTTNIVESVNSILERLRIKMGGFFQSQDALCVNVFIAINSLSQRKWAKGIPLVKGNIYQLQQLFVQRYQEMPKV